MERMRETTYWVLAALVPGPRHGYALLEETARLSGGRTRLKIATLYPTLERLVAQQLIETVGDEVVGGRRRRMYRLASAGATVLEAEAERLDDEARRARSLLREYGWSPLASGGAG